MNDECQFDLVSVLIEKIKQIRPDTLIINAFYDASRSGYKGLYSNIEGPALLEYLDTFAYSILGDNSNLYRHQSIHYKEEKNCVCHLSVEINKALAKHMNVALDTNVWNPTIPEYVEHKIKDTNYYWNEG